MKKSYSIYAIINLITKQMYIGSTINGRGRWFQHKSALKRGLHGNEYLQDSWKKYGEENFDFIILECIIVDDKKYVLSREQYYIDKYDTMNRENGFNKSPADLENNPIPEETRKKISLKRIGKKLKLTPEQRKKWSEMRKGENNSFYGKKHSKETLRILSEKASKRTREKNSFYGKKHTEETKKKIAEKLKGKSYLTEEGRKRISEANKNKIITEEYSKKLSEANIRRRERRSTLRFQLLCKFIKEHFIFTGNDNDFLVKKDIYENLFISWQEKQEGLDKDNVKIPNHSVFHKEFLNACKVLNYNVKWTKKKLNGYNTAIPIFGGFKYKHNIEAK